MAIRYLFDTNTVTALANGNVTALTHLQQISPDDRLAACFIVIGEWEYGILNAAGLQRQAQIRAAGSAIFAALSFVWESSPAVALVYGAIHAQLRQSGQMIPTNDVWIAAAALTHNAILVTSDPHFQRVSGLKVVDWLLP